MAKYSLEISRTAEQQLKKLPRDDQERVLEAILRLGEEPLPRGSRKLAGYEDVFRIRVARYRVLYSVSSRKLIIIVFKVGDRKDVYRWSQKKSEKPPFWGSFLLGCLFHRI